MIVQNVITFERLESDYSEIGKIRSVEVDHLRGRLILVCDSPEKQRNEGATPQLIKTFTSQYDENEA